MFNERISPKQLFALMVLFELGTALVVPIGLESGHAVWLAILLTLPGGLLVYLVYNDLYRQFPDQLISGYARIILGRWLGWPLGLFYVPILIFNASRNLREAGDLLAAASYDVTPLFFLDGMMIFAAVYILRKGIEVFARTAEIYLIVILILGLTCDFVVIFAGIVDLKNLFPIVAQDWKQALSSAYPNILIFPFGELICFTTILPHLNKSLKSTKAGMLAVIFSAILLSFTHAIEMSVLGENIYSRATFPMFTTVTLVNVANFIQRLDALVILTLIIGVFFKMTIYCYAAMTITADLFNVRDYRQLAIPVGIIALFGSFMSAENYPVHMDEGKVFMRFFLPFISLVVPVLLFAVHRIRKKWGLYPK